MEKMVLMVFLVFEVCSCMHHQKTDNDVMEFRFGNSDTDAEKRNSVSQRRPKFFDVYTNHPDVKVSRNTIFFAPNYFNSLSQEVETHFLKLHPQNKNHSLYHITRDRRPKFITDRKDILNFPNLEDLYSSTKTDFLESDYGDFESPTSQYLQSVASEDDEKYNGKFPS